MKQIPVKPKHLLIGTLVTATVLLCISVFAQVSRPYRNGSVWNIQFIRVKPGMDQAYMNYLASQWKTNQEALKKEGLILSYKVLATEAHGTGDWNLLLLTEYKDLATREANEPKEDAILQRVVGDDQKQMQGYRERAEIREVMGGRLAREVVLEPRR
jgi:hypothetical protein